MAEFSTALLATFLATAAAMVLTAHASEARAENIPGQHSDLCPLLKNPLVPSAEHPDLIGIYDGDWDGKLTQTIIVAEIQGKEVLAYYGHGIHEPWGIEEGLCWAQTGKLVGDNKIELDIFRNGAVVTLTLDGDGDTLNGTYVRAGNFTRGEFRRVGE